MIALKLGGLFGAASFLSIALSHVDAQPVPPGLTVERGTGADDAEDPDRLGYELERERMVLPVSVAGQGPFRFLVDTAAERTSISRELASALGLQAGPLATVHSMSEVSSVGTFRVPSVRFGRRGIEAIQAPAFDRRHIGADGILGSEALQGQRVVFDFERRQISIVPAGTGEERWSYGAIVVTGRRMFGRLVLVDASIDGQRVWVVIDTGSQISVGNRLLQQILARRRPDTELTSVEVTSVTGGRLQADYAMVRNVRIGDIFLERLPIAFADAHPFRQLRLMERPALLLGMDVLSMFQRVSVDFRNRRVRLLLRGTQPLQNIGVRRLE